MDKPTIDKAIFFLIVKSYIRHNTILSLTDNDNQQKKFMLLMPYPLSKFYRVKIEKESSGQFEEYEIDFEENNTLIIKNYISNGKRITAYLHLNNNDKWVLLH